MPHYLLQGSYSSQAWAKLTKNPEDRSEPVRKVIEGLGGKLVALFLAFGEYDVVALIEMPDNVSAAAFSIAGAAGGAIKNVKTTPLMTTEDGIAAMRKAADGRLSCSYLDAKRAGAQVASAIAVCFSGRARS